MRRLIPFLCLGLLAAGCLKSVPVQRLDQPATVRVAMVRDDALQRKAFAVPEALRRQVAAVLAERNLRPEFTPPERFLQAFGRMRDSQRRLQYLAGLDGRAAFVLLVETQAEFYSQLSGRYRWTVYIKLSIARPGAEARALSDSFDLPAVLRYEHEREPAALAEVAAGIARRLGPLLDDFLAGPGPGPPAARPEPAAAAVDPQSIYFVLLDRFEDGDRANDGPVSPADPAGWHGGDLAGVLDRLDYLQRMGFHTVWLSPVFASRHEPFHGHGAFHGYWTTDLTRVDPRFGDRALLGRLAAELHRRGMLLVLDLVVNHVGYDAPLAAEHPDWFHHQGTIEDWNDPRQVVEREVHGLPDLAQENPAVYAYLLGAARGWLADTGADGFRLDAVKHVPLSFWSRFNRDLRTSRPGLILLGEHYDGDPRRVDRVQRRGGFSHMFDFPLAFALKDVFCAGRSPGKIGAVLSNDRLYAEPRRLVTFLDNHDLPRIRSACEGDPERVRQALTAQFALRGVPCVTYGTEAGLQGSGEPENRGDMVFDRADMRPLKDHVTTLLGLRRDHPVLAGGATRLLGLDHDCLSLLRIGKHEAAWLVIHGGGKPVRLTVPAALAGFELTDALSGRGCQGELRLGPGESRLLWARPAAPEALAGLLPRGDGRRRVRLRVQAAGLQSGERLGLVGSGPELGNWDPARAAGPFHARAGARELELSLPSGLLFAYKLVAIDPKGQVRWEQRADRYLFVDAGRTPLALSLRWGEG